ncbi:MAG: PIG-L family deacetylase [Bryobacterales bacterium]|nr:PIG-L family deacetylase [Bryobacterales bacterium]
MRFRMFLPALLAGAAFAQLPLHTPPPGKLFLLIQPHHDDHSWAYGHAGLVARLVESGYTGHYVRLTNDEKDGSGTWAQNDIVNHRETVEAIRNLGMTDVISLNWRNDHTDSVPHVDIRAQIVLLIRKMLPDIVMSYHPWGHYDRNPDHRKLARAVADAIWAASQEDQYPEHFALGLKPYRVPHQYYSQRNDYGRGSRPNVAVEISAEHVAKKGRSFWLHRNVRLDPAMARRVRERLAKEGKHIPQIEGLSDEEAAMRLQEASMEYRARQVGARHGVRYAEEYSYRGPYADLPEMHEFLRGLGVTP